MNALSSTINTDFRAVRVTEHHPKDGGAASKGNYDAEKGDKVLQRFDLSKQFHPGCFATVRSSELGNASG
jgi:hypothetical protein